MLDTIKPYHDEEIKLLMKARNIITQAKQEGIILEFECDINNDEPKSYKDIIFEKNELEYVQNEVKNLEKKYKEEKAKIALDDLSSYESKIEEKNGYHYLITKVENQDMNILKEIADSLLNQMGQGFILIANVSKDQVHLVSRNNLDHLSSGDMIKQVTSQLNGNGGGSKTFAQGAGKDISKLDEVLESIKEQI